LSVIIIIAPPSGPVNHRLNEFGQWVAMWGGPSF
jgi:hypothetical protein